VAVTFTAALEKIFSPLAGVGFLAQATGLEAALRAGTAADVAATRAQLFNARLDAAVCALFLVLVSAIVVSSIRLWIGILRGKRSAALHEAPFVVSQLRAEEL